jgi:hypothetical protein
VRLHAHRDDDGVRPAPVSGSRTVETMSSCSVESMTVNPRACACAREALRDDVHSEHLLRGPVQGDAGGHVPDRPRPGTSTLPSSGVPAYWTACQAVGTASERNTQRSWGGPCGTSIGNVLPNGTRRYSACPPGTCP